MFGTHKSIPKKKLLFLVSLLGFLMWWWNCLPNPLFDRPLATELLAGDGSLLGARIAADGQWRMAAADSISPKLLDCVVSFEDERFYRHPGVDPIAVFRAMRDNYRAGYTVSGGSTITMQLARMIRGNRERTLWQKVIESLVALRISLTYDKREVLSMWADNAPYGGNVVGIEAACRRYFGRRPSQLSWAEAAVLAVLPNSPSLVRPGRRNDRLRTKRNALLKKLHAEGKFTATELELALTEPVPEKPTPLPNLAPHLLDRLGGTGSARIPSTIDQNLQRTIATVIDRHHHRLAGNQIFNLAVMVTRVADGAIIAYHGNVPGLAVQHSPHVDMITAPRSPGSLLKPILYGYSLEAGAIEPKQWLLDVPTSFRNFRPANFYLSFDGLVPADRALARSLNIPFVYLLRDYSVPKFYQDLRRNGFDQITQPPGHYGLSLILGGGEITMEEYHRWFEATARQLLMYDHSRQSGGQTSRNGLSAGAAYLTFEALRELRRPDELGAYRQFQSHRPVAWKTGTSFGFRDAWAVGTTPEFTVSVWAGNADGEGRPGLIGVGAAAPVLFEVFQLLDDRAGSAPVWFAPPYDEIAPRSYCRQSGYQATSQCPAVLASGLAGKESGKRCPYHQSVVLDTEGEHQVRLDCEPSATVMPRLIIPARAAHFYRGQHPDYEPPPPWRDDCLQFADTRKEMQLIYPEGSGTLSATKDWNGETQAFHFQLAHFRPEATVYWHLNDRYVGTTVLFHDLSLALPAGRHKLTMVDDRGKRLERSFAVE